MEGLVVKRNYADLMAVWAHLTRCDSDFAVPLSNRVSIRDYANRIVDRAERSEGWVGDLLVGLVALYPPDPSGNSFVTNVSVNAETRGRGVGKLLLSDALEMAGSLGAARVTLRVEPGALEARRLYAKLGFAPIQGEPSRWVRVLQ